MKLLEKILLVTDLGAASQGAEKTCGVLAQAFHSQVHLLHVVPSLLDSACNMEDLRELAWRELQEMGERLEQAGTTVLDSRVECGEPLDLTLALAEEQDVNVIVQGAGNYEPKSESTETIGIAAERVIRKSEKPVWTVKQPCAVPPKNMLCAVDFSEASTRALKNGLALAKTFEAVLHVVHVVPPINQQPGSYEPLYTRLKKTSMSSSQQSLEDYIRKFDFHHTRWQAHLLQGNPSEQILSVAREEAVDLLVMGAVGETKSKQLQLGAVALRLLRDLPCAAVTMKTEHAIRVSVDNLLADLETRFKQGRELLDTGHAEEALPFFMRCVEEDPTFAPAWEGIAEARHRLGQKTEAAAALDNARQIRARVWEKQVEFELRSRYWKK